MAQVEQLRRAETLLDEVASLLTEVRMRPRTTKRIVRDERGLISRVEENEVGDDD